MRLNSARDLGLYVRDRCAWRRHYGIANALAYDDMYLSPAAHGHEDRRRVRYRSTSGRHWRRFAQANGLDPDETVNRIDNLAARTPDVFAAAKDKAVRALRSRLPARLADRIATQASQCRKKLER